MPQNVPKRVTVIVRGYSNGGKVSIFLYSELKFSQMVLKLHFNCIDHVRSL